MTAILPVLGQVCDTLLHTLYPPACRVCDAPLFGHSPAVVCRTCHDRIDFIKDGACRFCGASAGKFARLDKGCARCSPHALAFTRAAAVCEYGTESRAIVHELKFFGNRALAKPMARMMSRRLQETGFPEKYDLVVPVPLHGKRLRERGYNQSGLLAREVARELGVELREDILRRIRDTRPQAGLSMYHRARNPKGAFVASGNLRGAVVLLVDDVITTGVTVSECAASLRRAGAGRVYVLAFSR